VPVLEHRGPGRAAAVVQRAVRQHADQRGLSTVHVPDHCNSDVIVHFLDIRHFKFVLII